MISGLLKKFLVGEWNLGFSRQNFLELLEHAQVSGKMELEVKWMNHKYGGSFFADPFIHSVTGVSAVIYAEEFVYARQKGILSILHVNANSGQLKKKELLLEESCHLSYPFYDDKLSVMYPESFRNRNWNKYSVEGIGQIISRQSVLNRGLIDATPVYHDGKWWIFAMTDSHPLSDLHLFYAETIDGPYIAHVGNPVKSDIASSRPAGKFFSYDGDLYRPVQDSTHRYGEGIHIMKIVELSESSFREEKFCDVSVVNNQKYPLGVHTINFLDDFIVIDGYRERYRPMLTVYVYKITPILKKVKHVFHRLSRMV